MNSCSSFEMTLSALLDAEAPRADIAPALSHLLDCAACADFVRECALLENAVSGLNAASAPDAALRGDSPAFEVLGPSRPGVWRWALAACIVLALGLWAGSAWLRATDQPNAGATAMTDERFASIATEVLQADPRYRSALRQALRVEAGWEEEGSLDADSEFENSRGSSDDIPGAIDFTSSDSQAAELPR
jgi:anti-sigma factor RsiW